MNSNMMPRDRHNAKLKAQYEKRKAKHLPVIAAMANTNTMKEIAIAIGTTVDFVNRVIKEEGLRSTSKN